MESSATPVAVEIARCAAKTRKGSACRNVAGHRTVHLGEGRCYLHGGLQPGDRRLSSGRYSTVTHERLRDLIAQHQDTLDPLDIFPELAAARALFQDFIERYGEMTEALLAWHEDWQLRRRPLPEDLVGAFERVVDEWENAIAEKEDDVSAGQKADAVDARKFLKVLRGVDVAGKPHMILDISDAIKHLDVITKIVEREEKKRSANAISRPDLNRVMHEMWRSIEVRVPSDETKALIREDWMAVRL